MQLPVHVLVESKRMFFLKKERKLIALRRAFSQGKDLFLLSLIQDVFWAVKLVEDKVAYQ